MAPSASSLNTSALAPMSMPRLGSSSRTTDGLVASILPMTTFCWLPPESEPIIAPPPSVLMWTSLIDRSISSCSRLREVNRPLVKAPMLASDRFWPTVIVCTRPSRWRSSGTSTRPGGDALGDAEPRDVLAVQQHPAARRLQPAGDAFHHLGAAGAHQPVDADDLAGAHVERQAVDHRISAPPGAGTLRFSIASATSPLS